MKRFLTLAAITAIALPAFAQDSVEPDWEMTRDTAKKSVVAYIPLTTGLAIGVRCTDGAYDAIIIGLPEAPRGKRTRMLSIAFGDESADPWTWNVTTNRSAAIADYPAPFARKLREGGRLQITIPGGGGEGRNLRHDITLPPSATAIDETLTACGKPTVDARDAILPEIEEAGLPDGVTWARPPRGEYPSESRYSEGYAVITCVVNPDGNLRECQVETQHPADGGFGEAALKSLPRARIDSPGEVQGQFAPRMIGFRTNFILR